MSQAYVIHRWTRADYDFAVSKGVFEDQRVELLYGFIVEMSPQGVPDSASIEELTHVLVAALGDRARVRVQLPFAASDVSEPEPDIAVVPKRNSREAHPSEAWLVVECSETSLKKDRETKAQLYAECGVLEYWVVNLVDDVIMVHSDIIGGSYGRVVSYKRGESITLQHFDDLTVAGDGHHRPGAELGLRVSITSAGGSPEASPMSNAARVRTAGASASPAS